MLRLTGAQIRFSEMRTFKASLFGQWKNHIQALRRKPERKTPIQYTNAYMWNLEDGNNNPVYETAKETLMYRTVFWTLWERERVG